MNLLKRYSLVIVWCLIIFIVSSIPSIPGPKDTVLNFILKKSAHITEYAILYFLVFKSVNYTKTVRQGKELIRELPRKTNYWLPLIFVILYATSDEIHQYFIPGRHARWYDIAFDVFGGLTSLYIIRKKR